MSDPGALIAAHVPLGSSMYERERLDGIARRAEQELRGAGITLVRTDPVTHPNDVGRAVAELSAADWDLLILNVINWIDVRAAARVALAFRERPALLYSYGGRTEGDVLISPAAGAGSTGLRHPLERFGMRFDYLFNAPDTPMDTAGVASMARAARPADSCRPRGWAWWAHTTWASTRRRSTSPGCAAGSAPRSSRSTCCSCDRPRTSSTPASSRTRRAGSSASWDEPFGPIPPDVLSRSVRLALATLRICSERGFDAFSYKSVEGVSLRWTRRTTWRRRWSHRRACRTSTRTTC